MSNLSVFDFKNHSVRVISTNPNAPLFVAKDVAIALGYKDFQKAIKQHCKGWVIHPPVETDGGTQEIRVIDEPDLYRLIFGSKLKSAVAFQDWVFEEVLPQIRKTGEFKLEVPSESEQRLLTDGRKSLSKAVKQIVAVKKRHGSTTTYQDVWALLHLKAGMKSIKHATPEQIQAGIVAATEILEGELLQPEPKQNESATFPEEQAQQIALRLNRVMGIFHPFSEQFNDLNGVMRLLCGRTPNTGQIMPGYQSPLSKS